MRLPCLKEGQDKYAFMEQCVLDESISKVILILDEAYQRKADSRTGGVGTETQIISAEVYARVDQRKFIPVPFQRTADGDLPVPTFLKSRVYVDLSLESTFAENYERLVRTIFDKPALRKPKLGAPPPYITAPEAPLTHTASYARDAIQAIERQSSGATPLLSRYLRELLGVFEAFRATRSEGKIFDDAVVESIELFRPFRDEFIQVLTAVAEFSGSDEGKVLALREFFEGVAVYLGPPESVSSWRATDFDNYRFIVHELFLYASAILISARLADAFDLFVGEPYFVADRNGGRHRRYDVFRERLDSLERDRKARLKLTDASVTARMLKERATEKRLDFEALMTADLVLALRGVFAPDDQAARWFPVTLVYRMRDHTPFALFRRAKAHRDFTVLARLLGVRDKTELKERFRNAVQKHEINKWHASDHWPIPFADLLGIDELDTL